jgi:two-component system NtrC family sensor kinase
MDELATQTSGPRIQTTRVLEAVVRALAARDTSVAESFTQKLPAWVDVVLEAAAQAAGGASLKLLTVAASKHDIAQLTIPVAASAEHPLVLLVDAPVNTEPATLATWEPVALLLCLALRESRRRAQLESELSARLDQLDEQRRFIERIIDSMPVGLYVVDRAYRIQAWNHKRETGLQGVARNRALGKTIFEVLHRQPAALLKREFDEVFASGRMQQFQMESEATGSVRTFRLSKIPMRIDESRPSHVTHVITVGEDITDWRAALDRTAQSEKLAALGQMATGVMHEINNPLATIAACAETLQLQAEDSANSPGVPQGDPTELLRIIDLEVQRCKRIVQGLLDFARPKPVVHDELDLNAVVRQTLFLLQHHPRRKQVSLVTELEEGTGLLVRGDADRLVQVLMALVLNALDASTQGARVVLRSASLRVGADTCSAIDVIDEGHGIPRESLSKVFEPFYTTKAPGSGTGLGLSICYGIVMEHGGVLAVDSALGHGATFRMLLPASGAPPLASGAGVPPLVHTPIGTAA